MKKVYNIPLEQREYARKTGRQDCPECDKNMSFFKSSFKKDEFYCSSCRLSVPLFDTFDNSCAGFYVVHVHDSRGPGMDIPQLSSPASDSTAYRY